MLVSTKGRYALRVMLELAGRDPETYTPLMEIAKAQNISEKYLESIIVLLSKANLVDSLRGKGGGYRLNRPTDKYPVTEILNLTESSLVPVSCLECSPNKCPNSSKCLTLPMWEELDELIQNYLGSKTLKDLLNK